MTEDKINNKGWAEYVQNVEVDGKIEKITSHIFHSTWRDNNFLSQKDKAKYEMMPVDSDDYSKLELNTEMRAPADGMSSGIGTVTSYAWCT